MSATHTITVGMAQMRVLADRPDANLARALQCIADASRAGRDVVVLPECLDIGWGDGRARRLAQPIPGPNGDLLATAAREHDIIIAAGLVERAGTLLYNAAVLIDEQGQRLLLHRKVNELQGVTGGLYATGDRLGVVRTRHGVIGIAICADNAPDSLEIGDVLARMGAQILLSPCAWAVPPDHDNLATPYGAPWHKAHGTLARRHGLPVVGVSCVGRLEDGLWNGGKVVGSSLAMGGDGAVIAQGAYGDAADELIVARLAVRRPAVAGCAPP